MLVLTRKQKECIKIGDSITITIVRVQGQAVRVGIEAPREVRVVRGELTASKPASTDTATDSTASDSTGPECETAAEPQVIEFRFSPSETRMKGADSQPRPARGPLASIMATLGTPGFISAAAAK